MKSFNDFKQQINEVLKASDPIEKWISDFVHSTNPKFAGKSNAERIEMAKGAYYAKQKSESVEESAAVNISTTPEQDMNESHLVHVDDGSKYDEKPHEKDVEHIMSGVKTHGGEHAGASDKGVFFKFKSKDAADAFRSHVNKCPHRSCGAEHVTEAVEYKGIGTDVVDKKKKLNPQPNFTTDKKQVKDFKEDEEELDESDSGLAAKAKKSGVSLSTLKTVYKRGVAAWNSGHRPGTTPAQWGMARVNSYITKGKGTYHGADKDLREDARLDKKEYHKGMSDSTAKARVAHWKKADKMSDSNPKAYEPAPGDKTAKTTPSVHTKKYHAMYGEGYEHGPIDRDAKVGVGHKAAVLAGSGLDSGKHGTIVGSSKERTGDMWHIKTASGDIVKMHKHRVAKLKEETVEEAKVYDPITKKMVATKPIKVQAGGGATRNGVPVETGPSKYKERPSRPGDIYGKSFTEEVEQIDELSKTTLQSYRKKVAKDVGRAYAIHQDPYKKTDKDDMRKLSNRVKGDERAEIGLKKEGIQIDEVSKSTLMRYIPAASRAAAQHVYTGKEAQAWAGHHMRAGDYAASDRQLATSKSELGKSIKRLKGIDTATKKLGTKKTYEQFVHGLEEATVASRKYDFGTMKTVHHGKSFSIPLHPEHHEPISKLKHGESHSFKDETGRKWKATRDNDTVHFHGGSYGTQKTSVPHSSLAESRGHKTLATFFKNREVAQRAFTGQNKQPEYSEKGIETPKAEKQEKLKEDQYTSDYKIKYYVDPITGESKTRKIRPHRVNFKNSKMRGEPVQQDAQGDYGMKEGFDNYDDIAKELIKRHGKNIDTGHINDLAGERDTHRGLDHSEVMAHVKKHLKEVETPEVDNEKWEDFKQHKHSIAHEKYKDFKFNKQSIVKALKRSKGEK